MLIVGGLAVDPADDEGQDGIYWWERREWGLHMSDRAVYLLAMGTQEWEERILRYV